MSAVRSKTDVLRQVDIELNAIGNTLGVVLILRQGKWQDNISALNSPTTLTVSGTQLASVFVIDPKQVVDRYKDARAYDDDSNNLISLRIKESFIRTFELLKAYSYSTNQSNSVFRTRSWFIFPQ